MKWLFRIKLRKIAKYTIIITLALTSIFGAFTIYGSQVGNFVINIENERNINLALYDTEALDDPKIHIGYPGLTDQTNTTLDRIPIDNIEIGIGDKNDYLGKTYLAFSFFLRNMSEIAINIDMTVQILKVTQNVDAASRIMVIADGVRTIYAKPKDFPENEIGQPEDYPYLTTPFPAPTIVAQQKFLDVKAGATIKFTFILWFEGYDAQCTDDIRGGKIRMEMKFRGY